MVKTWLPDPSHYPEQMTPLSATVWFASMGRGLHEAMRELAGPFGGFQTRTQAGRAGWHELSLPREAEMPHLTLESIRLLLEAPRHPASQAEPERERLEAETLARAPKLSEVLEPVKAAAPLKETHTYFIDYPALLATREVLLAFGRRLAGEGALADPDDVWMLRVDELREAVLEWRPLHHPVAERREELSRGRREGPRPFLGEPPVEHERHIVLEKFYG